MRLRSRATGTILLIKYIVIVSLWIYIYFTVSIITLLLKLNLYQDVAKKWVIGDNGRTRWSTNCNYPNAKFNIVGATKVMLFDRSKCSAHCLSIKRCTHFGWFMGTCWVKDMRGAPIVQTVEKLVPICGFVPVRKPSAV